MLFESGDLLTIQFRSSDGNEHTGTGVGLLGVREQQ